MDVLLLFVVAAQVLNYACSFTKNSSVLELNTFTLAEYSICLMLMPTRLPFFGFLFATEHQQQKKQVWPVELHSQDDPSYGPVQVL